MEKYAIYLRKSRADIELESIEKFETLEKHEKILKNLASKQGLNVVKVYKEIVSGESIEDRPEMKKLLNDVNMNFYDGVLVVEIERLARGDTKDQGIVAEAFKFSNTLIITPSKTYDPNDEFDQEYFEFGLFMSRREYNTIKRRLTTGKLLSIKDGNYMGSLPPYGYDIVRLNKKERTLKKNEASKYVILMYKWFTEEGLTCGEIAKRLTSMGIPTLTGKKEWNRATISDILKNDLYRGKIRWNRRKQTREYDGSTRKRIKRRQLSEDYLIVDGKHEALISDEVFFKAQSLFNGKVPIKAQTTIVNPLAGILVCKNCKSKILMNSYISKKNTCGRYIHKTSMYCKVKSSTVNDVMEALIQGLLSYIEDFKIKMNNDHENELLKQYELVIATMEKELQTLKTKREKLFDYFENGIYTENEFLERKVKLSESINELEKNLSKEKNNQPNKVDYTEKIFTFREIIESLKDNTIEARHKNELLKGIIDRIEYSCEDFGRQKGGCITLDIYLR